MKRILVTGGAGFIGSHLVDRLMAEGHEVTVVDSLSTGRRACLQQHLENLRFRFIQADVRDAGRMFEVCRGIEEVYHLAALADIVPSIVNPMEYFTTNVQGTANVLEAARQNGVRRFVYVASGSSYGIPDQYPTPETAEIRCEYPYALSKYLGELSALHWHKVYGLPVTVLKFFNIYGPRSRTTGAYGAVFGVFLAQKIAGQPFTIVGDGTQTRDFTYVSDAVDALVTAAASEVCGEVFNVGSGGTYSVNRLVELLGGSKVFVPKRPGEPDCTYADISKIGRMLGWKPKVGFEEGVQKMLQHLDDWRDAPVWTSDKIQEATKDWFAYLGKSK